MRQGWIIGVMVLWGIITVASNISEGQNVFGGATQYGSTTLQEDTLKSLSKPVVTVAKDPISATFTVLGDLWNIVLKFIQMVFLYYPAIWQGSGMSLYWLIFFPIGVSFVAGCIALLRGVAI